MFDLFRSLTKVLRLRKPGMVFLVIRKEEDMMKFVLVLPTIGAPDVVTRKLEIQVGGGEPQNFEFPGTATETDAFIGEQDDAVSGTLRDIDDAGNVSDPRDFGFVLEDTIAPPQPGEMGIRITEEFGDKPVDPPTDDELPPVDPTDEM